jgi:hypothetical protein
MSQDWTLNSRMFATWQINKIHGNKGLGFYQLIFPIAVTTHGIPKEQSKISVTDISGSLNVKGIGSLSQPTLVGRLIVRHSSNSIIKTYEHVGNHHVDLEIELDSKRIEAIEQIRLGRDLTFSINLYAIANQDGNSEQLYRQAYELPVSQSDWIKILENIDYRKMVLLEIPIPAGENNSLFREAVTHLENAQKQMLHGHYREAVSACRDVLESLNRSIDEGEPAQASKKKRDKRQRFLAIQTSLHELTHAAKHVDEITSLIEWNLADARASISLAATLLQWASEEYSD